MRRGEVWLVNSDPAHKAKSRKRRPAVILTVNSLNRARGTMLVVPLSTSARARPPLVIALPSAGYGSVAVCDQVCVADKGCFGKKIGELSSADMASLCEGVKTVLGLALRRQGV